MTAIICTNCNYRFVLKPAKQLPNRCTYCDTTGNFERVKSAQDLLDETVPRAQF